MRARTAFSLCSLLVSIGVARDAGAFCRTTTCDSQTEQCVRDASGCVITGIPLAWPGRCIGFDLQRDASAKVTLADATRTAQAAFGTWASASCGSGSTPSIQLQNLGPVVCNEVEYTSAGDASTGQGNANIIVFRDQSWPHPDALDRTLALTTVTFNANNGEIYDADMEINGDHPLTLSTPPPPGGYDLQSIMTHEAGHFLGLAHSANVHATMYPSYNTGTTAFRALSPDDVAAICAVYPPVRTVPDCDATPRHGFNSNCAVPLPTNGCSCRTSALGLAPDPEAYAPAGAALLGLVLLWRSKRSRPASISG